MSQFNEDTTDPINSEDMPPKSYSIIDINSGEIKDCNSFVHMLAAITVGRVTGGKWTANSKYPGKLFSLEQSLKMYDSLNYINYDAIPLVPRNHNITDDLPF